MNQRGWYPRQVLLKSNQLEPAIAHFSAVRLIPPGLVPMNQRGWYPRQMQLVEQSVGTSF